VIGCWSTAICDDADGWSSFGAEIVTPAMGPAIEGLSGLALFDRSHPAATANDTQRAETKVVRDIQRPFDGNIGRWMPSD
jgi:hypothetical protein